MAPNHLASKTMKPYTAGKCNWFLSSLHITGFITLPNFFQSPWQNTLHKLVSRILLYTILPLIGTLQVVSTFIYSIHDLPEFLQRLLETVLFVAYMGEIVNCTFRLGEITKLFNLQDQVFSVSNRKIYNKYQWKEDLELNLGILFNVLTVLGLILETMIPLSERTLYLMTTIYHKKHPERVLPFHIWTPSFIDISEKGTFLIVYLMEIYCLIILAVTIFNVIALQVIVPTPLVGQYEMFGEFIRKIGREHKDRSGEAVFYMNVSRGRYLMEAELLEYWAKDTSVKKNSFKVGTDNNFKRNLEIKLMIWKKTKYQNFFLKQIIERHQQLNYFMFKYHKLMISLNLLTTLPFLIVCILSCYQLAYLKHLPWFNCLKIIVEFFFVSGGLWHIITQSEALNHCNEIVQEAIYDSHWYNTSPESRKTVSLILQNAQTPKYLRFLNGLIVVKKDFLLGWYKTCFSFLNFMNLNGYL